MSEDGDGTDIGEPEGGIEEEQAGTGGPQPADGHEAAVPPVAPPNEEVERKWISRPGKLEGYECGLDRKDLQQRLNNAEYHHPPVDLQIDDVCAFHLPFYVSRQVIRDVRLKAEEALGVYDDEMQPAEDEWRAARRVRRDAGHAHERARADLDRQAKLGGKAFRDAQDKEERARKALETAERRFKEADQQRDKTKASADAVLKERLDALRAEVDSHPSRNRLRLLQLKCRPGNSREGAQGGGTDTDTYVCWLIADCGEDGKEAPKKFFPLDFTNLPLFRIVHETDHPPMRFRPRWGPLIEGDRFWRDDLSRVAGFEKELLAYLEFHFFAISGSGGPFEMIEDREQIVKKFDDKNSKGQSEEDLIRTLEKLERDSERDKIEPQFPWPGPTWETMVEEAPTEHVAARGDTGGVETDPKAPKMDDDSWRQPVANSVHYCVAHLLFSNRIYRTDIAITEVSGTVDLTTLQIKAADLPIIAQRTPPYDRVHLMRDATGGTKSRPKGWEDACDVPAEEFVAAAEKGGAGFAKLYYYHYLRRYYPDDFRKLKSSYGNFRAFLKEGESDLEDRFPWMRDPERRPFYVVDFVQASGMKFDPKINVRAYFEGHVIFESCEFNNSLDLSRCVFRRNLDLSNCEIKGALELNGTLIEAATAYRRGKPRLDLDHSLIDGPLLARGLRVGRGLLVSIRKSREPGQSGRDAGQPEEAAVRPVSARSVDIRGEVDLRGIKAGSLDFDSATIKGNFNLSSANLDDSSQDPGTSCRGVESYQELFGGKGGPKFPTDVKNGDWRKADLLASVNVVRLDFADVDGDVTLSGLHALYLFMRGSKFRGNLYLHPARIHGFYRKEKDHYIATHILRSIDMDFAEIRGIVHGEGLRTGLNKRGDEIWDALLTKSYREFRRLPRELRAKRLLSGDIHMSFIEAAAVNFQCFAVQPDAGGSVGPGMRAQLGENDIIRTRINGTLTMEGVRTKGRADFDGALVAGDLDLGLSAVGGMITARPVGPHVCEVYGNLDLTNTQVSGVAEFFGLWVGRSLRMPDAGFEEFFMRSTCVRGEDPVSDEAFCIRNPNVGHQINADNVTVRGTMNLTGIQIGFRPAFQGERHDGDRDENRDRLNMRYADINGPFLLWQGATIRNVARELPSTGAGLDMDSENIARACAVIRTRIFGDIRFNHGRVGAGLCLINTLVTGRAIFNDAAVGGDVSTQWPVSLERPGDPEETGGACIVHRADGNALSPDHAWKAMLEGFRQDLEPPKKNFLEIEERNGFFQCCRFSIELLDCRGDGFFCDTEIFDLENPGNEETPALPFTETNAFASIAEYSPDFLARQAQFQGRLEFAPWRDETEKQTALSREGGNGETLGGPQAAKVSGRLNLSFSQASFAVLDTDSFRSTILDYRSVVDRLNRLKRRKSCLQRKRAKGERPEFRRFMRGGRKRKLGYTPAHLEQRFNQLLPVAERNGNGGRRPARSKIPPIHLFEIRKLDLQAFGVDLERANIAHLEFLPDRDRSGGFWGWLRNKVSFWKPKTEKTRFPYTVNLHGLEVKRWDILPEYFGFLLDAQPAFEQSTYTMIQRELRDQGYVAEAAKIYVRMRLYQRKNLGFVMKRIDCLEKMLFKYFTVPFSTALLIFMVGWFLISWLLIFSNPQNVMPAPDSIENTKLTWRSNAHDAMREGDLKDWGMVESALVSLHYHLPFLTLRPGEKWQASDTDPLCLSFFNHKVWSACPKPYISPPRYGKEHQLRDGESHRSKAENKAPTWGFSLISRRHLLDWKEVSRAFDTTYRYAANSFTPEAYASFTALMHWLIYPFVIIAMSATVVRNRTAGQGRND